MERETGVEPATSSLGRWRSTTELLSPEWCGRQPRAHEAVGSILAAGESYHAQGLELSCRRCDWRRLSTDYLVSTVTAARTGRRTKARVFWLLRSRRRQAHRSWRWQVRHTPRTSASYRSQPWRVAAQPAPCGATWQRRPFTHFSHRAD